MTRPSCPTCDTPMTCPLCDAVHSSTLSAQDCKRIVDLWNGTVKGEVSKIRSLTKERKRKLRIRQEALGGTVDALIEWLVDVIKEINASPFLQGVNAQGWTAKFDWVIENENNATKVLEGTYRPAAQGMWQSRQEIQAAQSADPNKGKPITQLSDAELQERARRGDMTAKRVLDSRRQQKNDNVERDNDIATRARKLKRGRDSAPQSAIGN